MNFDEPLVWEYEGDIIVNAGTEVIWALLCEVSAWPEWDGGIERSELIGPFERGATIRLKRRGEDQITLRVLEVRESAGYVDEARISDVRVFVDRRLESISEDQTRVGFSLEAFGPSCEEIGPRWASHVAETLRALAQRAESLSCATVRP